MLCIACVMPRAREYNGRTALTNLRRRKIRSNLSIRTSIIILPRPPEVLEEPPNICTILVAHKSKAPNKTMSKSVMFQPRSSGSNKKFVQPSKRIRAPTSKTKNNNMTWLTHQKMGEGWSVSMPMMMAFKMMMQAPVHWNQGRSVHDKLTDLMQLMIFNVRSPMPTLLTKATEKSCSYPGQNSGTTTSTRRARRMIATSIQMRYQYCPSMKIWNPLRTMRHSNSMRYMTTKEKHTKR
mmetsp:Transcript_84703/g.213591  ORF Transcript_84703/g.213591 Transcript_84703/m.213591 type:complete len:237 (-) Transcript_84703:445-1155(-)